jgi:hypothetical protein
MSNVVLNPGFTQEIDLTNLTHASSSIPLSSVVGSLVNFNAYIANPFYGYKKYPLISNTVGFSGIVQIPVKNLPTNTFYSSDDTIVDVSTGTLVLSSTGTVTITATQDGKAVNGNVVYLSATATKTLSVQSLYKNTDW